MNLFSPSLTESVYPLKPNVVAMSCFSIKCFVDFSLSSWLHFYTLISADLMYSMGKGWEMHAFGLPKECKLPKTRILFFFFKL